MSTARFTLRTRARSSGLLLVAALAAALLMCLSVGDALAAAGHGEHEHGSAECPQQCCVAGNTLDRGFGPTPTATGAECDGAAGWSTRSAGRSEPGLADVLIRPDSAELQVFLK